MLHIKKHKLTYKKGLFLIIGESFRYGGQFSRKRDDPNSFEDQKLACLSHVNLINYLEENNDLKIDVMINSYETKYKNKLFDWYSPRLIKYKFFPDVIGWDAIFKTGVDLIENRQYDFIFIHRIDLVLKELLKQVLDIQRSNVAFASRTENHKLNDMMMFVPNKFFEMFFAKELSLNHYFLDFVNKDFLKNIDFMINQCHNSNSSKEWNPLYRIANRPEMRNPEQTSQTSQTSKNQFYYKNFFS